jgi:DNA repair exonuclease SbcCD ATPase subunit
VQTYFRSLDSGSEQQTLDLKRQLQVVEQEATILRTKTQTLESDNEKLAAENKQLHLQRIKKWPLEAENETALKVKITSLETKLTDAINKVTWIQNIFPTGPPFFSVL